jgi:hypothetical protein
MSTDGAFVTPEDPEERLIEIALDAWVGRARSALWFCGLVSVALGVTVGPLMALPMVTDPATRTVGGIVWTAGVGLSALVAGLGNGLLDLAAASGLGRGKRWAWYLAVALGALYLPGICCVFGVVLLYGMLNEKSRKLFLS